MSFKTVKLRWAKKLLKAKMFVVMTEKESAIAIDGADPYTFTDALALAAQAAELEMFHSSLGELIRDHQRALANISKESNNEATPNVVAEEAPATSGTGNAATPAKAGSKSRPVRAKDGGRKPSPKAKKSAAKK